MRRLFQLVLLVLLVGATATVPVASAMSRASIALGIGDAVDVVGTRIACFAITSNGKAGMACVLYARGKPLVGSYGAGLAVDGTAVLNRLKVDGTAAPIFKRRLQQHAGDTYRVHVGDTFGLQISARVSLGCRVIDVTSTLVEPLYRGVKVSCWRAGATQPLPGTYGVSISDKMAGVFRFDAHGRVGTWGIVRRQPPAATRTTLATSTRRAAADPITGSWLLTSRRTDLPSLPVHTISATATGFDLVTTEAYRSGAPQGVTFSVVERAAATDENAQCTVAAGAVVAHFRFTGTDAGGSRRYEGQMLKGQVSTGSPASCALIGLQGTYYAHLAQWGDPAEQPPLPTGPYNRLCIDEDPGPGCYVTFDRKGGTPVPTAVAPPATTTTGPPAAPKPPVAGLVPRNPRIPPDARFRADRTPPTVKAVASTGRRGAPFLLRYYSKDDSGFAGETYAIYRDTRRLKSWSVLAGERDGRLQRAPGVLSASVSGRLTFCVGAQDLNANRSRWSCAPLTIS